MGLAGRPRARRAALQGDQAAGLPYGIHSDYQCPFAVGRRIGVVRHRPLMPREIELPIFGAALGGCDDSHVRMNPYLRKQDPLRVQPRQPRGIRKQQGRLASQRRDCVCRPSTAGLDHGVCDPRAVRRKRQAVLKPRILGERNRLAAGKKLHVYLVGRVEGAVASVEGEHLAVGRQHRADRRVGEIRELGVRPFFSERTNWQE